MIHEYIWYFFSAKCIIFFFFFFFLSLSINVVCIALHHLSFQNSNALRNIHYFNVKMEMLQKVKLEFIYVTTIMSHYSK